MQERVRTGETAFFTTKVQAKIFIRPHLHNIMHANRTLPYHMYHTPPTERSFGDPSKQPCDPCGRSLECSSVERCSFQCRGGQEWVKRHFVGKWPSVIQRIPTLFSSTIIQPSIHEPAEITPPLSPDKRPQTQV